MPAGRHGAYAYFRALYPPLRGPRRAVARGTVVLALAALAVCGPGLHVLVVPDVARAEKPSAELERELERERRRARREELLLGELTREEKRLRADLVEIAERVKRLNAELESKQLLLDKVHGEERRIQDELMALTRAKRDTMSELRQLVDALWRMHVGRDLVKTGGNPPQWEEADRRFTWTSSLYRRLDGSLASLKRQQQAIRVALSKRQSLASEARTRLAAINTTKDRLLTDQLRFRRELREVRGEKVDKEEELRQILDLVRDLDYKLAVQQKLEKRGFKALKGELPWPVDGRLAAKYRPKSKPPRRGIGISTRPGAEVRAVSWGKVAHNDVLRGFGRVVIVMHGEDYYSLYAFLASSDMKVGKTVLRGETLGIAGFYPELDGPGVYFELRFHQKAINPEIWLTAQR